MLARYTGAFGCSTALHAVIAVWLAWSAFIPSTSSRSRHVDVVLVPPAEDGTFPGLKPVDRADPSWRTGDFSRDGAIGDADLDQIATRIAVLFPFVSPGLDIDAFFPGRSSSTHLTFETPFSPPPSPIPTGGRRLSITAAQLQALIDQSWTRAKRWSGFKRISPFCSTYDPDDPALATLLASYRDQNALQPYADGQVRDLRLWAQLGLASDHVAFIGFIRQYARSHPHTRATTELLFLLDTIAQANEDALAVLVETNQPGDLDWTRQTHPRAYDLAHQIQRQYSRELERRGLTSRAAVEAYYDSGRLAFLTRILATTPGGYRANDARFLMGRILWKDKRRNEAVRIWREITNDVASQDAYAKAIVEIGAAVQTPAPDPRNVDYILKNQEGRWLSFSQDRLKRFGYRFDTFAP
jgi:hypothetical protein